MRERKKKETKRERRERKASFYVVIFLKGID